MNRLGILLLCCAVSSLSCSAVAAPIGLYWTDNGKVQYSGLDGSNVTTLVDGLLNPQGLDVTADYLYWTDRDDQRIRQTNTNGRHRCAGSVERDLDVTDAYIYFVNTGNIDSVSRANTDGSGASALVTVDLSFPNGIAVTDSYIY
jgi:hypothetical protein